MSLSVRKSNWPFKFNRNTDVTDNIIENSAHFVTRKQYNIFLFHSFVSYWTSFFAGRWVVNKYRNSIDTYYCNVWILKSGIGVFPIECIQPIYGSLANWKRAATGDDQRISGEHKYWLFFYVFVRVVQKNNSNIIFYINF